MKPEVITLHVNGRAHPRGARPQRDAADGAARPGLHRRQVRLREGRLRRLRRAAAMRERTAEAVNSCLVLAWQADGADITTVGGAGHGRAAPSRCRRRLPTRARSSAATARPGLIIAAKALLDRNPHPTEAEIREAIAGNLCRCTGYGQIVEAVQVAADKLSAAERRRAVSRYTAKPLPPVELPELRQVGKPLRRVDAMGKAVGATVYAGDFSMPRMLHAKVFRSTQASARIMRLDVSKARALPGVVCVLTAADLPDAKLVSDMPGQTGQKQRAGSDVPVLASDRVRFYGEPIALIAAETLDIAERALTLIEIDYEPLPGVFDPLEAMKPGAPIVHPPDNVVARWKIRKGDLEAGFAEADLIVENTFRVPYQEHAYLEPEAGVAWMDERGVINIRVSTQVDRALPQHRAGGGRAAEQDSHPGHDGRRRLRRQRRHHGRDLPGPAGQAHQPPGEAGLHARGIDRRPFQAPPVRHHSIAPASRRTGASRPPRSRSFRTRAPIRISAPTCCSTPP